MPKFTQRELKRLLDYNPETGVFTWSSQNSRHAGEVAGYKRMCSYRIISIGGRKYLAHRLAWLYMTGGWPRNDIDHRNGIRDDNRFCNLRDVTRSVNLQNQRKANSQNSTGLLGVGRYKDRFKAQIVVHGKQKYLGTFDTAIDAHAAYRKAKKQLHIGAAS